MGHFDDLIRDFKRMDGMKIDITETVDMDKLQKALDRKQFENIRRRITF
jgi:hypothetical protein